MRSYCRFWGASLSWTDPPPNDPPSGGVILWDKTSDGLAAQVDSVSTAVAGRSVTINWSGQQYVLLDTDLVLFLVQNCGQFGVQPAGLQENSPRGSWYPALNTAADHYHGPDSKDPGGGTPAEQPGTSGGARATSGGDWRVSKVEAVLAFVRDAISNVYASTVLSNRQKAQLVAQISDIADRMINKQITPDQAFAELEKLLDIA